MRLGIDASNIRSGGGITHLVELLRAANPITYGFDSVVVWASSSTLARIEPRPWLIGRQEPVLELHYLRRAFWQRRRLGVLARLERCDVLFAPGGTVATSFRPIVCMSRNLLPFDLREMARYRLSATALRLWVLRSLQSRSFRAADGVVFLTSYAKDRVQRVVGPLKNRVGIIPHGVDRRFFRARNGARGIAECSTEDPFRILYVSIVDLYKHQWHVAEAVARLRASGLPVSLDLIGPAYRPALRRLRNAMRRLDPAGAFLRYCGEVPHEDLPQCYARADLGVFASSCENMPNILLEGMASAVPIACSDRGPMPEVLRDAGVYFNPESVNSISRALRQLIDSPQLRVAVGNAGAGLAQQYSWARCADETFRFLAQVAREWVSR